MIHYYSLPTAQHRMGVLRGLLFPAVVWVVAGLAGCDAPAPDYPVVKVKGKVTIDGELLQSGGLTFSPQEVGHGPGTGAEVKEGQYKVDDLPVGKVLVRFRGTKATGRMVKVAGIEQEERKDLIPPAYQAGIQIDVAAGETTRDFELSSKGPAKR